MALLPKSKSDFSSKDYWETFFKKRGNKAFEWYGEYSSYCGLIAKYVKIKDAILELGCGNSELGAQMYDCGYENITCIDISCKAIQQMTQKHSRIRPELKFLEMDLFNMTFSDGEFSVVLDKGTLDAIYSEDTPEKEEQVSRMFEEVARLLKIGGRYICFSLAQSFISRKIINVFAEWGWLVRVCLIPSDSDNSDFYMPVFIFVLTKLKKLPASKLLLETAFIDEKVERLDTPTDVIKSVEDVQNYALVRHNIRRYIIYIVEAPVSTLKKFGIFIVPLGRELEWLFSTTEGRQQLHKSCGHGRLLVVLLSRCHHYGDIEAVKAELSTKVLELAPPNVGKQSPFMTIGNSVSMRTIREEGQSGLSGGYVVEDVSVDEKVFRRLVFLSMPDNFQSQALLLKTVKRGAKKGSRVEAMVVDHSHLSSPYCKSIVASLALLPRSFIDGGAVKMAMLGVGGGTLPMFLLNALPNVTIDAVELEEKVVEVGRKWFGLGGGGVEERGRLRLVVQDAMEFVEEARKKGKLYDVLVVDIDNKDLQSALSFPPAAFVETDFIYSLREVLAPLGVLVLNLVTRSHSNRTMVIERLKHVFSEVLSRKADDEVNEVCYCLSGCRTVEADQSNSTVISEKVVSSLDHVREGGECLRTMIGKHNKKYLDAISDINFKSIKFL